MPFKRRLRLLVASPAHPEWADEALAIARERWPAQIEARATDPDGVGAQWADLQLWLGPAEVGAPHPPRRRVLALQPDMDATARRERIEREIAGIAGGLRMLERL